MVTHISMGQVINKERDTGGNRAFQNKTGNHHNSHENTNISNTEITKNLRIYSESKNNTG